MPATGEILEGAGPDEGPVHRGADDRPTSPDVENVPPVHLRYRPTMRDHLRLNADLVRRSLVGLAVAGFIIGGGSVSLVAGDHFGVVVVAFGLSLASGLFVVPFVWLTVHRRADLLLAEVDFMADATGLTHTTAVSTTRQAWSVYRRVRETGDAFLLDQGTGRTVPILKRGAEPAQIVALRALFDTAGLRRSQPGRLRSLSAAVAALVLGAAVLPGYFVLQTFPRTLGANATISLSTAVNGRTIAVRGMTDLPDGSSVAVELVQLDEYDRARAAGAAPDPADSPWIRVSYVTAEAGSFATSFDVPTWPPGRASAGAYFWMQPGQPAAAGARFGPDGGSMSGPNVVQTADRGRMLEVQTTFQLP